MTHDRTSNLVGSMAAPRPSGSVLIRISWLTAISLAAACPTPARASCNLIPVAAASFPSEKGGVIGPIAATGETVQLELNGCDPSAGFESAPLNNDITLTFEPPGPGNNTDVAVGPSDIVSVTNCTLPGGRCRTLRFRIPDTTAQLPPYGLAGPARIVVRDLLNNVVAEIATLYLPALSCDKEPETVFEKFTVLPSPNNYADVRDGVATEVLATVDGGNNLLVPLDYWGSGTRSVLVDRPGAPEARFIEGDTPIETFTGSGVTISQALATALANNSSLNPANFVRSFTLTGRPLPPLLRVKGNGTGLYGTADAVASVLRIKRDDGSPGGLFDVTDRLFSNRGPIVIGSPSLTVASPLPLRSLRSATDSVAFARDETREHISINPDGDDGDLVTQVVDAETAAVTNTAEAVTEIAAGLSFIAPAIVASNDRVAFLMYEDGQAGTVMNSDGDPNDSFLRAYLSDGTQLHPVAPLIEADTARLIDGQPLAISGTKVFFRSQDRMVDAESSTDGFGIVLSPDGAHAYVTDTAGVSGYSRDPLTGELTALLPEFDVGAGTAGIAVTPDGANVYVAREIAQTLRVYERDSLTGDLTFVEDQLAGTYPPGPGLLGPHTVAISPDSSFVYVASNVSDSIDVYERTGVSGELTFVESEVNGFGGVSTLDNPESIAISPDGLHLYVTALGSITAFSRNLLTGELALIEAERDGVAGVDGLNGAALLAISLDGRYVYVPAAFDAAVSVFERDVLTGALTYVTAYFDDVDVPFGSLLFAVGAAVSADGQRVFVTTIEGVLIFRRNSETGALMFEHWIVESAGMSPLGIAALSEPYLLTDLGTLLYVVGQTSRLHVLRTDHRLAVLETDSCGPGCPLLTPAGDAPHATRVAVAGDDAAFLRPESGDLVDRNGTGDELDDIVYLYDTAGGGSTTSLGIAGNRLAMSTTLLAFTVPEANEGGGNCTATVPPGGCDLNGDTDARDDVLHVYERSPGPGVVVNTGQTADRIAVTGDTVVFISPDDGMLHLYEYDSGTNTGTPSVVAPASDFIVDGSIVAFRTDEAVVGQSLNPDSDTVDLVMRAYDLSDSSLVSTGRSAIECKLPGCDPNLPYKATDGTSNRTIAFLTDERDEAAYPAGDLDLDGDAEDIVLTLYSLRSGVADTIGTVLASNGCTNNSDCTADKACAVNSGRCESIEPSRISPFPEGPFDGTLVINEVLESTLGDVPDGGDCDEEDINLDGDCDDTVVVLVGDADEDGTVDGTDVCSEIEQDEQNDADADGLGDDQCDPNLPPECGALARLTCRAAGKASVQFKRDADNPNKDQLKFSWSKGAQTDLAAFGDPPNDLGSSYSLCIYDGSGASQPIAHGVALAGGRFCGKKRCWSAVSTKGFKLGDKDGVPLGITGMKLGAGAAGKAKVGVKGKGANLDVPELPLSVPVTVQLVVETDMGEECWSATFSSADVQSSEQWKAKN